MTWASAAGAGPSPPRRAYPPTPRSTTTPASCFSSITERPRLTCTTESSTRVTGWCTTCRSTCPAAACTRPGSTRTSRPASASSRAAAAPATSAGSRPGGRPYRYNYAATNEPGWFLFSGLVKHDTLTGREEQYQFSPGVFCSDVGVAPGVGGTDEDGAYLVTRERSCPSGSLVARTAAGRRASPCKGGSRPA